MSWQNKTRSNFLVSLSVNLFSLITRGKCVNGVNCWYNLAVSVQLEFVRHIHSYISSAWKPYQFIYSQYKNHANSYIRSTKTMPLHIAKVVSSKSVHREVYIVWSVNCHGSVVSSWYYTNKTDHHDIAEILLKVALNTINQSTNQPIPILCSIGELFIYRIEIF